MRKSVHIALGIVIVGVLTALLLFFLRRWCCHRHPRPSPAGASLPPLPRSADDGSFQTKLTKLHQASLLRQLDTSEIKRRGGLNNCYVYRRGFSGGSAGKPLFNWSDHPTLVADAIENGWSRFGFSGCSPAPATGSTKSAILGFCAGDCVGDSDTEINWEVCNGSADFMQKIRLNPGLRKINHNINHTHTHNTASINQNQINNFSSGDGSAGAVVRAALPLPGPHLGSSFPQEAYFEITILAVRGGAIDDQDFPLVEGENIKLIREDKHINGEKTIVVSKVGKKEELKIEIKDGGGREEEDQEEIGICLGLSIGGFVHMKLPGRYPGSIGFNSNGSIYLDGMKLVFESDKHKWARPNTVIGCGFDPRKKKVFFTINSHLAHVINCKAEDFGMPLYPIIAADDEATVLVNFGQSAFAYGPSNGQRTPNPCFVGPIVRSPATTVGFEDSKELFSMGRIDSQYLARITKRENNGNDSNTNSGIIAQKVDFDEESDGDLFEIVLESSGKSPSMR